MANKKQPHSWFQVKPGDIISFRYKTKATSATGSLTKITNLNLKLDVKIRNDTGKEQ